MELHFNYNYMYSGIVTTACALFVIPAGIAFYYNPIVNSCTVTGAEPVISAIMVSVSAIILENVS